MKKHILLSTIIFAAIAIVGFASLGNSTDVKRSTMATQNIGEAASTGWELKSLNPDELKSEVVDWASKHYQLSHDAQKAQDQRPLSQDADIQEQLLPASQLSLDQFVEFEVIPIPEGRRVPGYEDLVLPTYHAVALLKDARGDLYNVVLGSSDSEKKSFAVLSVGPFLDNTVEAMNLSLEERRIHSWPPVTAAKKQRLITQDVSTISALSGQPKPVLIPYPYSMNQIYWQYGDNIETAVFESIHSGQTYQGLMGVLDAVDEDWRTLREPNQGQEKPMRKNRQI